MYKQGDNVILTGFMGTGKSTVGRLLAQALAYTFVDTDALVEARAGRSIPQIFAASGEAAFRRLEAEVVTDLAARRSLVIATGGGLVLNPDNVAILNRSGMILCLSATPAAILARVAGDAERPLLQGPDPAGRIAELLTERAPIYGQFPQIDTTGRKPHHVVRDILITMWPAG